MTYAQIKDGVVKNIIVLEDENLIDVFKQGFDHLIRIDNLEGRIGIGSAYDGENFSPPPVINDPLEH